MKKIGMIGLGVMGRNLALNFADLGVEVCGLDLNPIARSRFQEAGLGEAETDVLTLVTKLEAPRIVILMVPAGSAVDAQLKTLLELLSPGDIVVDCGNSFFRDTERRDGEAALRGIRFVGLGVSGGEDGARRGPSLMAGGAAETVESIRPLLLPLAAKVDGQPCFVYCGSGGAGHFVKMMHNGIEYACMQMIAEAYYLLRHLGGYSPAAVATIFGEWNQGPLASYLMEISAEILSTVDPETGLPLVEVIADAAGQKGTGHWAVSAAMQLGVPAPTIAAAVNARCLSSNLRIERTQREIAPLSELSVNAVHDALLGGTICAYAQGFAVLGAARRDYGWALDIAQVANAWRGGCIIRSRLLEDIGAVLSDRTDAGHLLDAAPLCDYLGRAETGWRQAVGNALANAIPIPALASTLGYWDGLCRSKLWTDLVQAQRDRFGAHGFRRVDRDGSHHGPWASGE